MKKTARWIFILVLVVIVVYGANLYWRNLRGVMPALRGPAEDITQLIKDQEPPGSDEKQPVEQNQTDFPFQLPDGFSISVFAKDLPKARVMVFDGQGNMWVSQTRAGEVSLLEVKNGQVTAQTAVFKDLNNPHGLAFDPDDPNLLYIAEEDRVSTVRTYSDGTLQKIVDLPPRGGHFTRTLLFRAGDLLISVGSSCNVCEEGDDRRAKILLFEREGGTVREFARGLRNSVFMALNPLSGEVWATDNGRDLLGDDVPPDEINIVREGQNYGWPICYGKNIHDIEFDKNTYVRNPCQEPFETGSHVDLQAHSAPLGLGFVPEGSSWPADWWNDIIVAFHGSWNRTVPTGYKLVRVKLDEQGNHLGTEDFITGWLRGNTALGRPVDILIEGDGTMYVSDDHAGVIYRVTYDERGDN